MAKRKKANDGVKAKPRKTKKANIVNNPDVLKVREVSPVIEHPKPKRVVETCAICAHYHPTAADLGVCYCVASQWYTVVRRNHKTCESWAKA